MIAMKTMLLMMWVVGVWWISSAHLLTSALPPQLAPQIGHPVTTPSPTPPGRVTPPLQAPGQEQHGTSNTGRRRRLQQEPAPAPVAPPRVVVWTLAPVDIAPGVPASAKASVKQTVASINAAIGRMVTGLLVQAPGVR